MRAHDADVLEGDLCGPDEAVANRQDRLGVDRQRRVVEEVVRLVHGSRERALDREDAEGHLALGCGLHDGREARKRDEVGAVREEAVAGSCGVRAVAPWISDIHCH